ncbi:MAG: acyltransferase family protein, partial [Pricia sp.]
MQQKQRRYDIDWWRVIAILAVYLHHVCMPFNGDKFHIMNAESSTVLDDIMVFFEQIRLPLLFLISGTGTVFAFSKRSSWQFVKERSYRLLVPLIFGVLVIVPPQTYFENIDDFNSYGQFYGRLGAYLEVNHLWFIENLFYISIVCIPLVLFLRSESSVKFRRAIESWSSSSYGIFLWVIPLIVVKVVSKIYFPEDSKSIANLSSSLFYGYLFVAGIV